MAFARLQPVKIVTMFVRVQFIAHAAVIERVNRNHNAPAALFIFSFSFSRPGGMTPYDESTRVHAAGTYAIYENRHVTPTEYMQVVFEGLAEWRHASGSAINKSDLLNGPLCCPRM